MQLIQNYALIALGYNYWLDIYSKVYTYITTYNHKSSYVVNILMVFRPIKALQHSTISKLLQQLNCKSVIVQTQFLYNEWKIDFGKVYILDRSFQSSIMQEILYKGWLLIKVVPYGICFQYWQPSETQRPVTRVSLQLMSSLVKLTVTVPMRCEITVRSRSPKYFFDYKVAKQNRHPLNHAYKSQSWRFFHENDQ